MENQSQPEKEQSLESAPAEAKQTPSSSPTAQTSGNREPEKSDEPKVASVFGQIRENRYLYIVIFVVFILVIAGVTFWSIKNSNDKAKNNGASANLTSDNLATLKGATTLVGDPKQILDIQSNAVFEGQVLVRGELNSAGDLKVGKDLSVTGAGTFNQLQTIGNLTVNGSQTIKASLSVSGDGAFSGKLSASQLTVGTLNLTSDLTITKHITVSGSLPKVSAGSVGSGGTVSISGSDTAGTVTINSGSGPTAGNLVTVTFATAFKSTPHVVVTPVGVAAGTLDYYVTRSNNAFTVATVNAPASGSSFSFDYVVIN